MSNFGVIQKNVLSQYIVGQPSPQQDKKYTPDKLSPMMMSVQNFNVYPFSAFGFVEVMVKKPLSKSPHRQSMTSSKSSTRQSGQLNKSPFRQSIMSRGSIIQERDEQEDEFEKKILQEPTLLTGVLIGPQHLLVQLDQTNISCSDLKVTIGQYGRVNVIDIFRSRYLALNRFTVLLLDQHVGIERGYLGLIAGKRTFNSRYYYTLDSVVEPDVQPKKNGVIVTGYTKNLYHSMQTFHNLVSDIMGGVLMNIQVDRNSISKDVESFARNHWPILVNDPEAGYCVAGFTQELNSKGLKGILINSEQFHQIVLFTQNYQPQDILRIPCCAQLSEDEYRVDVKSIKAHRKRIFNVVRINYRMIASTDQEKKLKIWQIDSKKVYSEIDLSSNSFCLVADNKHLYVCLQDQIQVWDWQLRQQVSSIQCPHPITHLIKINSKYMVSADVGGQVIIWKNDEIYKIILQPSASVDCTEVTSMVLFNERFVAVGFSNGKIRTFDVSQGVQMRILDNGHFIKNKQNPVNTMVVFNQEYLISGSSDQTVVIWSLSNEFKILKRMKFDNAVLSICALNEKEMLIAHGSHVSVYNLSSDQSYNLTQYYQPHQDIVLFCTAVDHEMFCTSDLSGTIRFWKIDKVIDEVYESISHEELQKISDQLRDPNNYNYFFFRNFVQFSSIPAVQTQQLNSREKQLKIEIDQYKLNQIKQQHELDQTQQIMRNKDNDIQSQNNQIQKLSKEIEVLNNKLQQSNTKLEQQSEQSQILQSQLKGVGSNENKLSKELEQWKNKYQNLLEQQQRQQKQQEINNQSQINESFQKEKDQYQRQIKQLTLTISNIESENSRLKKQVNNGEQQQQQLSTNGNYQSSQQRPSKSQERNNQNQNSEYSQQERDQQQRQIKQLTLTISNIENENNRLKRQVNTLEQEKQQLSSNGNYQSSVRDTSKSPSKPQRVTYQTNKSMIDPKEEEINKLKIELQNQLSQNELLNQQLESQRLDILEKSNEIEAMKNSLQSLKDSFNEIQNLQQKKHKLDLNQKEKEKEEILQILNDQRLQNQKMMKTLESTRDQHIKNLQESNKERRQMLENQNSLTNSIALHNSNTPNTINRNNSFNSRAYYQQPQQTQQLDSNQERVNYDQRNTADIQSFKKEITMIQDQIQSLKKSVLTSSNSNNNILNSSTQGLKQNEYIPDRYNYGQNDKTAQKKHGNYLDPNQHTPLQNKKSPSKNLTSSTYYDKSISVSQDLSSSQLPVNNKKSQLQQILQSKLQELQEELSRRQNKQAFQDQQENQRERGRSQKNTSYSPQKFKRDISSSPIPKQQRMYTQGSVNSSIVITGNKSIGDFIGSPLKVNKCNIELDISAVEEDQQSYQQNYSSPQRTYNQQTHPHFTVHLEAESQNRNKI